MKTTMMGLIALSILLSGGPAAFSATSELKIATIDLKKAFDAYYKTKLADASIKDEASGLEKDLKALTEDHDKAVTEYK
jgi:Skp family chaperone for outer membrane proteins